MIHEMAVQEIFHTCLRVRAAQHGMQYLSRSFPEISKKMAVETHRRLPAPRHFSGEIIHEMASQIRGLEMLCAQPKMRTLTH